VALGLWAIKMAQYSSEEKLFLNSCEGNQKIGGS
jgi:hypothetical protein